MKTLVLGSGPSALAYLFMDKEAVALGGPDPGGQFANSRNLGPQLLWVTPETQLLLEQLGLPTNKRLVNVGYKWGDSIYHDPDAAIREIFTNAYALKTRGHLPQSTYMSEGKNSYEVFSIGVDQLVEELYRRVRGRITAQSAKGITLNWDYVTTEEGTYDYDTLVSTVPAPVFMNLLGPNQDWFDPAKLTAFNKGYVKIHPDIYDHWMQVAREHYDYVYCPGEEVSFHRVKFDHNFAVLEYTYKDPDLQVRGPGVVFQKNGQITGGGELLSLFPKHVKFLGRYARWKHGIKFHDTLKEILEILP